MVANWAIMDDMSDVLDYVPMTPAQVSDYRSRDLADRKIAADDIDDLLYAAAVAYVKSYDGDFSYVVGLKDSHRIHGRLSMGQCAGALNCAVADHRFKARQAAKAQAAAEPASQSSAIPHLTYTVVLDDGRITLRFSEWKGKTVISYLKGPDNELDFGGCGTVEGAVFLPWSRFRGGSFAARVARAVAIIAATGADGRQEMTREYAVMSGRCARCGRTLTVPASIHAGLGPDCAAKLG